MPRCCCWHFGISTFGWCCCCCTVPSSDEQLPLLEQDEVFDLHLSDQSNNSTIHELRVSESYLSTKSMIPRKNKIRIVTASDTHMNHEKLHLPAGDILLLAGDLVNWKTASENREEVMEWLAGLNQYQYKIVISGNHGVDLDGKEPLMIAAEFKEKADVIYLHDTAVEALGLKLYGSPWHPKRGCLFHAEAFGKSVKELEGIFGDIPSDTDIMISHSPPYGVRDLQHGRHVGSDSLLRNVQRIEPILHIFGHVHEEQGMQRLQGMDTMFVNTATKVNVFDVIFPEYESNGTNADSGGGIVIEEEEPPL